MNARTGEQNTIGCAVIADGGGWAPGRRSSMMVGPDSRPGARRGPLRGTLLFMKAWPRVNRSRSLLAVALILPAAAACAGCGTTKAKDAVAKPASPAKVEKLPGEADLTTVTLTPEAEVRLRLKTAPVESGELVKTRTVGGEVVIPPGKLLAVSAPIAGTLLAPKAGIAAPGTRVAKGQVIFNLVPILSSEARVTAATTLVEARGQVDQLEKQVAQDQGLLDRAERLRQGSIGSRGAVEDARAKLEVSKASLKGAVSRRDAIDQAIRGAEGGTLQAVPIAAEGGGILRNLHVAPGQMVAPGTILFDVVDLDPAHVRVPIYVGAVSQLDETKPAEVGGLADAPGIPTRTARRVADPPSGDPLAATVDLFFEVENKDGALRPGQRVGVTLPFRGAKAALVVPRAALLSDYDGGTWVYEALGSHKFARRRVRVDSVVGDRASLASGPKAGTQVVTDGAFELYGTEFGGAK